MTKKYRNYTDQDVINNASQVKSIAGLLRSLGLREAGGNYINIKRILQKLQVDTSHWTREGWSKNKQLKCIQNYTQSVHRKKHLIKQRGHECQRCNLKQWFGEPITLELEHIDGNRGNNDQWNLKLLCPNCHSQTPTWRRPKA